MNGFAQMPLQDQVMLGLMTNGAILIALGILILLFGSLVIGFMWLGEKLLDWVFPLDKRPIHLPYERQIAALQASEATV